MKSLRRQLMVAFLPLVLAPVLVVAFVTRGVAEQGVTLSVSQEARQRAGTLAQCFALYYEEHGSWDGLSAQLSAQQAVERSFTFTLRTEVDNVMPRSTSSSAPAGLPTPATGKVPLASSLLPDAPLAPLAPAPPLPIMGGVQPTSGSRILPLGGDYAINCSLSPSTGVNIISIARLEPPSEGTPIVPDRLWRFASTIQKTPPRIRLVPDFAPKWNIEFSQVAGSIIGSLVPRVDRIDDAARRVHISAPTTAELPVNFGPGELLIADSSGKIVAASSAAHVGQAISTGALATGAAIIVQDRAVGTLVMGTAAGLLDSSQRQLLDTVNLALVASGGISALLALGLGWWISWQISAPARQLMTGVKKLASGRWSGPLPVRTRNEFGELTHAFNGMASEIMRQQHLNRQMVADVAHDLRTPLSVMALEVEAIEAGLQTPAEATASLRGEITWLQRLVDDLRTLSLMDADQIQLQFEQTQLHRFLCSVFDFWQTLAEEGGKLLTLDAPHDLPIVEVDPGRMRRVLGNLIDNAIQHTEPGDRITLAARSERDGVVIRVADEGEGIAPEDLPHIFDRFYRSDPSRKRSEKETGSGLGLSIASRLVEMHGGTISVASTPGHGSTFTLRLPLQARPAPRETAFRNLAPGAATARVYEP